MGGIPSWIELHWFDVIQTVGIVVSIWMGIAASNRDSNARENETLLALAAKHQELWAGFRDKPELSRVLRMDADVLAEPLQIIEEEFINSVFAHFLTAWRITVRGGIITLDELADDLRDFLAHPIPRAVWETKAKAYRNKRFVMFVEEKVLNKSAL